MKISKKDWIFIVVIAAVVITFLAISGPEKTKKVPYDDNHRSFYELAKGGLKGQKEADLGCPRCHNETGGIPFPAKHPIKPSAGPMSSHLCHKYDKSRF